MFTLIRLLLSSRSALVAENLFLRKQLALLKERKTRSRASRVTRIMMLALSRFFDWRSALVVVKPETFIKWHREAFRMFWRWKSRRRGRPPLPRNIRELVRQMDHENPTWGEERIAAELSLKLGIAISPATVRKYLQSNDPQRRKDQRWSTFVRKEAKSIVACDFFISVTASFRILSMANSKCSSKPIGW